MLLMRVQVSDIVDDQGLSYCLGRNEGRNLGWSDLGEGLRDAGSRVDDDGAVEAIFNLTAVVGVIPIGTILGGVPAVNIGLVLHDRTLSDTGDTVVPWRAEHLDTYAHQNQSVLLLLADYTGSQLHTMEVDRGVLSGNVVDGNLDLISLVQLDNRAGRLLIDEAVFADVAIGGGKPF